MKITDIKKVIIFFILLLTWISRCRLRDIGITNWVFISVYCISIIIPYAIKPKAVVFFIVAAITVGVGLYDISYLTNALPPLLLIYAHKYALEEGGKNKGKKSDDGISNIYVVFSTMASVLQIIYTAVIAKDFPVVTPDNMVLNSILWMLVTILVLVIVSVRDKKNVNIQLRGVYFAALFGIAVAFLCYFPTEGMYLSERARKKLVYWFLFILMLCINEDPIIKYVVENITMVINGGSQNKKAK